MLCFFLLPAFNLSGDAKQSEEGSLQTLCISIRISLIDFICIGGCYWQKWQIMHLIVRTYIEESCFFFLLKLELMCLKIWDFFFLVFC